MLLHSKNNATSDLALAHSVVGPVNDEMNTLSQTNDVFVGQTHSVNADNGFEAKVT